MVVSSSVSNNSPIGISVHLVSDGATTGGGESAANAATPVSTRHDHDRIRIRDLRGSDLPVVEVVAPSARNILLCGVVEYGGGKSDTANNCSTAVQVTVR